MPLNVPDLDDRNYDDLVREALALIPAVAPDWTNHNVSDPGITLVELLAYLTEILIYRTNRITDAQLAVFLSLLIGQPCSRDRPLAEQIRQAVLDIRNGAGAVTAADYERLARQCAPGKLARAHCLPGYNLNIKVEDRQRPGHISVVVVPVPDTKERHPRPGQELLASIRRGLEDYRLVTTRLHVVGPQYVPVYIDGTLALLQNAPEGDTVDRVRAALEDFLKVLPGKDEVESESWPFGGDVYLSELYEVIERLPGIDYVAALELGSENPARFIRNDKGQVVGVDLRENELPVANIKNLRVMRSPRPPGEGGIVDAR
jgi:hypothetical protein